MGYDKHPAEKALFMTQAQGLPETIESALGWIEQHQFDHDFHEQLFIVKKEKEEEKKQENNDQLDNIMTGIEKCIDSAYNQDDPDQAKVCFKTCALYAGNVLKDVNDEKYQKINLANEAF